MQRVWMNHEPNARQDGMTLLIQEVNITHIEPDLLPNIQLHDDIMTQKHFPSYWTFVSCFVQNFEPTHHKQHTCRWSSTKQYQAIGTSEDYKVREDFQILYRILAYWLMSSVLNMTLNKNYSILFYSILKMIGKLKEMLWMNKNS